MRNVEITLVHENAKIPKYQTEGSAAFDFAIVEATTIEPNKIAKVRTGLIILTPKDHALIIASRSSNPIKKGIDMANSIGVVDSDYAGPEDEIFLLLKNITESPVTLLPGDRVAQGLFVPITHATFTEAKRPDQKNRGGHGSTGK